MEASPALPLPVPVSIQGTSRPYSTHEERQEALLFESVLDWFNKHPTKLDVIVRILTKKDKTVPISLTLLDWFVSNYSKTNHCYFKSAITGEVADVHEQYLLQLKGFSKKKSDPFCRSQRFKLTILRSGDQTEVITTSVRQLNFLRWIAQSGILDYILEHVSALHEEYMKFKETSKTKKDPAAALVADLHERTVVTSGTFELNFT